MAGVVLIVAGLAMVKFATVRLWPPGGKSTAPS